MARESKHTRHFFFCLTLGGIGFAAIGFFWISKTPLTAAIGFVLGLFAGLFGSALLKSLHDLKPTTIAIANSNPICPSCNCEHTYIMMSLLNFCKFVSVTFLVMNPSIAKGTLRWKCAACKTTFDIKSGKAIQK
ncbi:MAG TPA: hypothetical protein EYO40_08760 [Phycisphaerales bacterium]|nr:hypothetical protein [Phycisphaerales bacterium]